MQLRTVFQPEWFCGCYCRAWSNMDFLCFNLFSRSVYKLHVLFDYDGKQNSTFPGELKKKCFVLPFFGCRILRDGGIVCKKQGKVQFSQAWERVETV